MAKSVNGSLYLLANYPVMDTQWHNPSSNMKKSMREESLNPLMHNVPKWTDTLKNLAACAARFLKCV